MMTAAARSETLPIRLIAEAPRKIRSNLGRLVARGCIWVMDRKRVVPTNDAPSGTLFLSDKGGKIKRVMGRQQAQARCQRTFVTGGCVGGLGKRFRLIGEARGA